MHTKWTAPLAVLASAVLLILIGCSPVAQKPTITIAADKDSVAASGTVGFTATVSPTAATVAWSATGGTLSSASGTTTTWTAPATTGDYTITGIATNGTVKDTDTKAIKVYATTPPWVQGEVEFDNIDNYPIPNPGTTYSPIRFPDDEWAPTGAVVESANAVIDIDYGGDPDSIPMMDIWIESPDGSRVQIWNESQTGDPSGEYPNDLLAAFGGKPVNGTWKLVVTAAESNPVAGSIDGFDIDLKYRFQQ